MNKAFLSNGSIRGAFQAGAMSKILTQGINNVKPQEHTLGQMLAYLVAERKIDKPAKGRDLSQKEKNYLQTLRQRSEEIMYLNGGAGIFMNMPAHSCQNQQSYLADNHDFFLALLFCRRRESGFTEECRRLSIHLNNCFVCFETFCQVMRDYYYQSQALS